MILTNEHKAIVERKLQEVARKIAAPYLRDVWSFDLRLKDRIPHSGTIAATPGVTVLIEVLWPDGLHNINALLRDMFRSMAQHHWCEAPVLASQAPPIHQRERESYLAKCALLRTIECQRTQLDVVSAGTDNKVVRGHIAAATRELAKAYEAYARGMRV
jgi:hypothetical protein